MLGETRDGPVFVLWHAFGAGTPIRSVLPKPLLQIPLFKVYLANTSVISQESGVSMIPQTHWVGVGKVKETRFQGWGHGFLSQSQAQGASSEWQCPASKVWDLSRRLGGRKD